MAGPGAEVLRRLGAIVVTLPGGEIMPALKSGAIDASEWIGPWLDMAIGLHKAVGYYYYPALSRAGLRLHGRHQQGRVGKLRRRATGGSIEAVAAGEYARSLAEFNANNALSLRKLRDEGTVKILKFDNSLLKAFLTISKDVVAEIGAGDELSRKIYASYQQFRASIMDWSDITERAYPEQPQPRLMMPGRTGAVGWVERSSRETQHPAAGAPRVGSRHSPRRRA